MPSRAHDLLLGTVPLIIILIILIIIIQIQSSPLIFL